jgi:hypothetical protein
VNLLTACQTKVKKTAVFGENPVITGLLPFDFEPVT